MKLDHDNRIGKKNAMLSNAFQYITFKDHATNEEVSYQIQDVTGNHDGLLSIVEKRMLRWHGQDPLT